jgi:hypothetical protein
MNVKKVLENRNRYQHNNIIQIKEHFKRIPDIQILKLLLSITNKTADDANKNIKKLFQPVQMEQNKMMA